MALAAVLGADACEIYTDVDGVYTTDPRVVPEARKIDRISYDEMLELASLGAGVMHSRSIEFAKKYGVPIHVRSSFTDTPGTWIVAERRGPAAGRRASPARPWQGRGADHRPRRPRPPRRGPHPVPRDRRGERRRRHDRPERRPPAGATDVSFTVAADDLAETLPCGRGGRGGSARRGSRTTPTWRRSRSSGLGMRTHTGVATACSTPWPTRA